MQDEIKDLYSKVRAIVANGDYDGMSRDTVIRHIKAELKSKVGIVTWRERRKRYWYYPSAEWRQHKRFVKDKHHYMKLESRERKMLEKMIGSIVDELVDTSESFEELDKAINKMNSCNYTARMINTDCDNIMAELEKISNYMDTGKWNTTQD